jgi:hypothetical protein
MSHDFSDPGAAAVDKEGEKDAYYQVAAHGMGGKIFGLLTIAGRLGGTGESRHGGGRGNADVHLM